MNMISLSLKVTFSLFLHPKANAPEATSSVLFAGPLLQLLTSFLH